MALTKQGIVEDLIEKNLFSKQTAITFVESFFNKMTSTLVSGADLKISGFGVFHVRSKNSRPGRNPITGEQVEVSSRKVVVFHSGRKLKGQINGETNIDDEMD